MSTQPDRPLRLGFTALLVVCLSLTPTFRAEADWEPYFGDLGIHGDYWPLLAFYEDEESYSGGVCHLKVGSERKIYKHRVVRQDFWPYEEAGEEHVYYYQPTDPGSWPNMTWVPTDQPGFSRYVVNFSGIPGAGDPDPDVSFYGDVVVVEGTVSVPATIPHKPGASPATIEYSVLPETLPEGGIHFDPSKTHPVVVELHDPAFITHRYRHLLGGQAGSGSFSWDGRLWTYNAQGNITGGPFYCIASTVFAKIIVDVEDLYWEWEEEEEEWELVSHPFAFTFEMPGFAVWGDKGYVWGEDKGYLGQKRTLTCDYQGDLSGQVQWSGGGDPSSGQGSPFSTRFFSETTKTITASATVDGQNLQASWQLPIKDIFMYNDGGKEYSGIYPGNPQFAVYASRLIDDEEAWDSDYVYMSGNGDPTSAKFETGWVDLFRSDVNHAANTLRNSKYYMDDDDVEELPIFEDNDNLVPFSWRGHMEPYIISATAYPDNQDKVKQTGANCHGNVAHCFGVMTLSLAHGNLVEVELGYIGATVGVKPVNIPVGQVMSHIEQGGIIFFDGTPAAANHSAYVLSVGVGEDARKNTMIWAANAGVDDEGTADGFDVVSLGDYLDEHSAVTHVSFYNDIDD